MKKDIVLLLLLILLPSLVEAKRVVKVAAAANLRYVLEQIRQDYEKAHPNDDIEITFGSSGTLTGQIVNGAPFDLFMAADIDFPKKVYQAGYAASSVKTYIFGKVALWSASINLSKGINSVLLPSIKHISIADPQKAPYGKLSVYALKKTGLYTKIAKKIVWGEDIGQAAQFAFSGNAEIGFVALALAKAPNMRNKGKYYILPTKICPPVRQACVILKYGAHNKAAVDFMNYFMSKKCNRTWINFGYALTNRKQ